MRSIKRAQNVLEKIKYVSTAVLTPEEFARLVNIDKVIIGETVYEESSDLNDIWSKTIILTYIGPPSKEKKQNTYELSYDYTVRHKNGLSVYT